MYMGRVYSFSAAEVNALYVFTTIDFSYRTRPKFVYSLYYCKSYELMATFEIPNNCIDISRILIEMYDLY